MGTRPFGSEFRRGPPSARLASLTLPLVFVACGFGGQPHETGRPLDDGIAPYRQAGAVQLCAGEARVVASQRSASEGTGACVPTEREARRCVQGCGPREACVCDRCTVAICADTSDCPEGLTCVGSPGRCGVRCNEDSECGAGGRCDRGVCSAACESDDQCAFGERCSTRSGLCTVSRCGESGPRCGSDQRCDAQQVVRDLSEPSVLATGRTTVLYYASRGPDGVTAVYRARSDDGLAFRADPLDPVLAPEDGGGAGGPSVDVLANGAVDVYFDRPDGSGIWVARASDGVSFGEPVPVLAPASAWEEGRIASPSVVHVGRDIYLFYEGGERAGIGLATGQDTGLLQRPSDEPVVLPAQLEDPLLWRGVDRVGAPFATIAVSPLGGARTLRLFVTARGAEGSSTVSGDTLVPPPLNDSIGLLVAPLDTGPLTLTPWPFDPIFARVAELGGYRGEREAVVTRVGDENRLYFVGTDVTGLSPEGLLLATNPPRSGL